MNQSLVPSSILLSLLSLVSWLTLSACSPIPERLTSSLSNASAIIKKNAPFIDYISHSRHLIQAARVDLDSTTKETIIQANSPFEYRPSSEQCKNPSGRFQYKRGILLIHGLTASPYMMEDLARFFHARCFLVRAILLPGHGTRPGDLLDIHYQDWIKTGSRLLTMAYVHSKGRSKICFWPVIPSGVRLLSTTRFADKSWRNLRRHNRELNTHGHL